MDMSLFFPHPTLNLFTFFPVFLSTYVVSYFVVFRNWSPKQRAEASSSFTSLAHGTPAAIMSIRALLETPSPSFASLNLPLHTTIFEFSLAYFLVDLLHYVVFFPKDTLFILHHVATMYVLVTCRYVVRHGAYGLVGLLLLAEVTNPFQNVWSIAGYRKVDVPAAAKLHELLSPPFFCFYSVVRGVLGPLYVIKLCSFYLSGAGDGMVPTWAWISWLVIVTVAILVSILWVKSHWVCWFRQRMHQAYKKGR